MPHGIKPGDVRPCPAASSHTAASFRFSPSRQRKKVTVCLVLRRMALSVQLYLKIDRLDQAEKQLKVRDPQAHLRGLPADVFVVILLKDTTWCRQCLPWTMMLP